MLHPLPKFSCKWTPNFLNKSSFTFLAYLQLIKQKIPKTPNKIPKFSKIFQCGNTPDSKNHVTKFKFWNP